MLIGTAIIAFLLGMGIMLLATASFGNPRAIQAEKDAREWKESCCSWFDRNEALQRENAELTEQIAVRSSCEESLKADLESLNLKLEGCRDVSAQTLKDFDEFKRSHETTIFGVNASLQEQKGIVEQKSAYIKTLESRIYEANRWVGEVQDGIRRLAKPLEEIDGAIGCEVVKSIEPEQRIVISDGHGFCGENAPKIEWPSVPYKTVGDSLKERNIDLSNL